MSFTAQELNHRITFERAEITRDEAGGVIETWIAFGEAFAKVEPLVGREFFAAMAHNAERSVKFTIRYRNDLLPSDRVVYDGTSWDITSAISVKGRNRETLIYAKRIN